MHFSHDLDPLQACPKKLGDTLTCSQKASVVVAENFVNMMALGMGAVRPSTSRQM